MVCAGVAGARARASCVCVCVCVCVRARARAHACLFSTTIFAKLLRPSTTLVAICSGTFASIDASHKTHSDWEHVRKPGAQPAGLMVARLWPTRQTQSCSHEVACRFQAKSSTPLARRRSHSPSCISLGAQPPAAILRRRIQSNGMPTYSRSRMRHSHRMQPFEREISSRGRLHDHCCSNHNRSGTT
ncbi:hypothetical protein F4780DRAFT_78433 [Xylariomycetidae sp. FL0641]|nr:hypothetical protein F4780DRAFT_78433 [Xylariomycetidae sp. FL0641]